LHNSTQNTTVTETMQFPQISIVKNAPHTTPSCPSCAFCPDEAWPVVNVRLQNGSVLRGFARGEGKRDLQLQTFDGRLHLLSASDYREISREKTSYMPPLDASPVERRDLVPY